MDTLRYLVRGPNFQGSANTTKYVIYNSILFSNSLLAFKETDL